MSLYNTHMRKKIIIIVLPTGIQKFQIKQYNKK